MMVSVEAHHYDACPTLEGDVRNGGDGACLGIGEGIWEISVFFTPFCWEPKITLNLESKT